MKIRIGFVSNSSSSSYIVEIKGINEQDFLNKLYHEYSWKYFMKSKIEEDLLKCIEEDKSAKTNLKLDKIFQDLHARWLRQSENDFNQLKEINTNEELVRFVLEHNRITIKSDEDEIELFASTSMHNDFHDMPQLLREIILFFMFDTLHKIKCRRTDRYSES